MSNFASGVLLVTFRPAKVGDYIEAAGVAGTVDEITVFSTRLVTPDRRTITVPNSKLFDGAIVNYSTSSTRRLDLVFGISYDSDVELAQRILRTGSSRATPAPSRSTSRCRSACWRWPTRR